MMIILRPEAREDNNIQVKLLGNGNDIYDVQGSKKISVFDYKTRRMQNACGASFAYDDY
jgi:hypothetical protein